MSCKHSQGELTGSAGSKGIDCSRALFPLEPRAVDCKNIGKCQKNQTLLAFDKNPYHPLCTNWHCTCKAIGETFTSNWEQSERLPSQWAFQLEICGFVFSTNILALCSSMLTYYSSRYAAAAAAPPVWGYAFSLAVGHVFCSSDKQLMLQAQN